MLVLHRERKISGATRSRILNCLALCTALRLGSLARWEVALWPPELAVDIPELSVETLASAAACSFATSTSAYRSSPLIRVAGRARHPRIESGHGDGCVWVRVARFFPSEPSRYSDDGDILLFEREVGARDLP